MAKLRTARLKDSLQILRLLVTMHKESGMAPLDDDKALEYIENIIRNGVVYVAYIGDKLIGTIGLQRQSYWYSQEAFITDTWFFVHPAYRKSRVAVQLLNAAIDLVKGHRLMIGLTTEVDLDRKEKFMARKMRKCGALFYKDC